MEKNVDKLTKTYTIEDDEGNVKEFTLGITRAIAVKGFKKYPEFFDAVIKNQNAIEKAEKGEQPKGNEMLDLLSLSVDTQKYSKLIVDYVLADMLEYAENDLTEYNNYKEYAESIVKYCDENYILYDYIDENENLCQGFYTNVMELVSLGFTSDSIRKKGKAKMIIK